MPQRKHSRGHDTIRSGTALPGFGKPSDEGARKKLEVVLKSDSFGSSEAVSTILRNMQIPEVEIRVIHAGVGSISKSDLLMALTGSRLVLGFNVGMVPKLDQWAREQGVEVRLYKVIYRLIEDVKGIAHSLIERTEIEEKILGRARVIALFKSDHRGAILGCEVTEGILAVGRSFRIISAMGPVYTGKIESLQIEKRSTKEAKPGQQVGLKVSGFDKARVGDEIECFETTPPRKSTAWKPSGNVFHFDS